jgi:broad specificity phosphatase PhoE
MSPRINKKASSKRKKDLEIDQTTKILKNVSDAEAFYFYENVGRPTGKSARNLTDFLNTVNMIKLESLQFHLERKDFQKWFKEILGDRQLAERMEKISLADNEELRARIKEVLENRLRELQDTYITLEVKSEEPTNSYQQISN